METEKEKNTVPFIKNSKDKEDMFLFVISDLFKSDKAYKTINKL